MPSLSGFPLTSKRLTITLRKSDWFCEFNQSYARQSFDFLISNPPYIDPVDKSLQSSTRFEPKRALFSKDGGLAEIKKIIAGAKIWLKKGGWLMLENGHQQSEKIEKILKKTGYSKIKTHEDLRNRVVDTHKTASDPGRNR